MPKASLQSQLDAYVQQYNQPEFIAADPIVVPHAFTQKQDVEIAGLFAAIFAWGQRTTIIAKSRELMERMDNRPHEFVLHHSENDLRALTGFQHRTFNDTDLLYLLAFLQAHYQEHNSLEAAFLPPSTAFVSMEQCLMHFHEQVFCFDWAPQRTRKHIATPARHSACKRLNMYLRWMVRKDGAGVDFGLWNRLPTSGLIMPLDVHVQRVARKLGLLQREQADWQAAIELTNALRAFDAHDPVKYDFALFGMGLEVRRGALWT
ncbi:MAG: TIGR02757 family protein [Sphingobacteriaceae bacterium]|nr:TIGR02757 family protein [Sphingobacteriaceae bacterium]